MKVTGADPRSLLRIYLNDHLAGAIGAIELTRRTIGNNTGTKLGEDLQELLVEIEEDRRTLERIMERLGLPKDPVKQAAAWTLEKVGRLKLNGQLVGYSDLSRMIELEGLSGGIDLKRNLWRALHTLVDSEPRLGEFDLAALEERAGRQRLAVEEHRLDAARRAFVGAGSTRS